MVDLVLAVLHHLFIFALFGVLIGELILVRHGMGAPAAARMASIDIWYGVLAGLILIVGFSRAIFAAKGWRYYEHNAFFHAKIAVFLVIALLSVRPTVVFIRWRGAPLDPTAGQIAEVRRYLWIELLLFPLLLVCAAAMARGYGEF
jgi:putative membrane protein